MQLLQRQVRHHHCTSGFADKNWLQGGGTGAPQNVRHIRAAIVILAPVHPPSPMQLLGPLGGAQNGKFFGILPPYINVKSKPGDSTLPPPSPGDWLRIAVQLRHIWASPNLVWAIIALAFYFCFPYDLSPQGSAAAAPVSLAFFKQRFPLWLALTHGYTAFWHITLYWLQWSDRPLIPSRIFSVGKVLHNVLHSTCGIAQWVVFENVFAFLWATGRLAYLSDTDAASSWSGLAIFVVGLIAIPLWRDGAFVQLRAFIDVAHTPTQFTSTSRTACCTSSPCSPLCTRCTTATRTLSRSLVCACIPSSTSSACFVALLITPLV